MHLYYKQSALCIVVDCAKGDCEGFLHLMRSNDPPIAIFPSSEVFKRHHPSVQSSAWGKNDNFMLRRRGRTVKDQKEPLSTRGWTLQETILSPRTIHYSTAELKWECQKTISSENYWLGATFTHIKSAAS